MASSLASRPSPLDRASAPSTPSPSADTSVNNPYQGNRHLTEEQQTLLGEYARLANTIQSIAARATALSATNTHSALLSELRILERKMGLVLVLFKASVWSVVTADMDAMAGEEEAGTGTGEDTSGAGANAGANAVAAAYSGHPNLAFSNQYDSHHGGMEVGPHPTMSDQGLADSSEQAYDAHSVYAYQGGQDAL